MSKNTHKNNSSDFVKDENGKYLFSDQVTVASTHEELFLDFHLGHVSNSEENGVNGSVQRIAIPRSIAESFADMLRDAASSDNERPNDESDKFFGLWASMTDEEQMIFDQMQEERSLHLNRELPEFIDA